MTPAGDAHSLQAPPRLFGVAELDNVVADGGAGPGQLHVVEAGTREGAPGAEAGAIMRDGMAAEKFALGFCARSRRPSAWIAPPPDLLSHVQGATAGTSAGALPARRIETIWAGRTPVRPAFLAQSGCVVAVLDARRAARLEPALRLARNLVRRRLTAVLLAADAELAAARLGMAAAVWRISAVDGSGDAWAIELVRQDRVRRVLARACDASGRLGPAPRLHAPGAKELARRLARR